MAHASSDWAYPLISAPSRMCTRQQHWPITRFPLASRSTITGFSNEWAIEKSGSTEKSERSRANPISNKKRTERSFERRLSSFSIPFFAPHYFSVFIRFVLLFIRIVVRVLVCVCMFVRIRDLLWFSHESNGSFGFCAFRWHLSYRVATWKVPRKRPHHQHQPPRSSMSPSSKRWPKSSWSVSYRIKIT